MTDSSSTPRVVVGVDGSALAANALEFAIEEAQLRNAALHVTYAYTVMASAVTGSTGKDYYEQVEAEAKAFLEAIMAAAPSTEGLDVEWLGVPGNPSEVLIEASRGATLLVVGSRGQGGFFGLLMGSVSTQCVHYSHCPVLVVRESH
ncbi:MAG TPA: universal stress protein [Acidimicrobiales bacterium]|nr:universal stress protein [Acidimicrobiales bacterium]